MFQELGTEATHPGGWGRPGPTRPLAGTAVVPALHRILFTVLYKVSFFKPFKAEFVFLGVLMDTASETDEIASKMNPLDVRWE